MRSALATDKLESAKHGRAIRTSAGVAVLFATVSAGADDRPQPPPSPPSHGLELGARAGISHPGGSVGAGSEATTPTLDDLAAAAFPIGLDAGYRFGAPVYAGATLEWSPTSRAGSGPCVACSYVYDLQVRAEVRFFLLPRHTFDPWLSLGFGWEVLHVDVGTGSETGSATYQGPILANAQIGLDVRARAFAVGPYFGLSLAEFAVRSLEPAPLEESSSIPARTVHEWFTLGLRGSYGPF